MNAINQTLLARASAKLGPQVSIAIGLLVLAFDQLCVQYMYCRILRVLYTRTPGLATTTRGIHPPAPPI